MSDENKPLDPKLAEPLRGIWDSLTDEQKEKAKACKTLDELTELAGREGIELPDEVLDAIAGGYVFYNGRSYEVIRDSDGEVLAGGMAWNQEQAEGLARSEGQSQDEIIWLQLDRLRKTGSIGPNQTSVSSAPSAPSKGC